MIEEGPAVVTGGASGIGRALAVELAARRHQVHVVDLSPTRELAAQIGGTPHVADVADPAKMYDLAASVPDATVVCLNAGVVGPTMGAPWEAPLEEWQRLLGVNLLGAVNGLAAFVPMLVAAGRPARILITASLAGLLTFPGGGAYAATKHALVAVAEQTALALADTPVTVTLLCPALVRTAMSEAGEEPRDVAVAALDAMESGRFVVAPDEWSDSIRDRADRLALGVPPVVPSPTTPGDPHE